MPSRQLPMEFAHNLPSWIMLTQQLSAKDRICISSCTRMQIALSHGRVSMVMLWSSLPVICNWVHATTSIIGVKVTFKMMMLLRKPLLPRAALPLLGATLRTRLIQPWVTERNTPSYSELGEQFLICGKTIQDQLCRSDLTILSLQLRSTVTRAVRIQCQWPRRSTHSSCSATSTGVPETLMDLKVRHPTPHSLLMSVMVKSLSNSGSILPLNPDKDLEAFTWLLNPENAHLFTLLHQVRAHPQFGWNLRCKRDWEEAQQLVLPLPSWSLSFASVCAQL